MEKKLHDVGDEVNDYIVKAQAALAEYNFFSGNRDGRAKQIDIDKIRDWLADAEYCSRQL